MKWTAYILRLSASLWLLPVLLLLLRQREWSDAPHRDRQGGSGPVARWLAAELRRVAEAGRTTTHRDNSASISEKGGAGKIPGRGDMSVCVQHPPSIFASRKAASSISSSTDRHCAHHTIHITNVSTDRHCTRTIHITNVSKTRNAPGTLHAPSHRPAALPTHLPIRLS
jgi:hypothetical protein